MVHVALVRSRHAHARITRVDVESARRQPGVVDVVTHADLGPAGRPVPFGPPHPALRGKNWRALAADRVRFVGEAVAAVVADSRYAAEDAAEAVDIAYEPLPAVSDGVEGGAEAGGPPVHDDVPDNVAAALRMARGDVEAALRAAPHVVRERLVIGRGGGQPIEPRGLLADYNRAAGQLTVWASTQIPHALRLVVAEMLALPPYRVRVVAPDVGGGFGAKLVVYPEDVLVPFLALRLERPVKWLEDRLEHMLAATQERVQVHDVAAGFDGEGRLLAFRDHFVHDAGAYTPRGLVVPLATASMLAGPYRIPTIEVAARCLYTNRVPVTPYRGAGQPQAVFAVERTLDLVARALGRDRAAVRLANLVRPDEMPHDVGLPRYRGGGTVVYDGGDFPAVLRRALEIARYDELVSRCAAARARGRLQGLGVACYVEGTGIGPYEGATVRVDPAGRLTVFTGAASQGQGIETTLAQVCAGELGVTPEDVAVVDGDTLGIEHGIGTYASRVAVVAGTAVLLAARAVRAKALRLAAGRLGVGVEELEVSGARVFARGRPEAGVSFAELAALAGLAAAGTATPPGLEATHYFQPEETTYSSGAHVVLVEVDPVTARVALLGYWIAHDAGRLINPMVVEGQIQGGVALGLGSALLEEIVYDEAGQLLTGTFMDYLLPTATDVPAMAIDHLETPAATNPLGLRGVGESGTLPVAAVIASAVEDALAGRRVPVTRVPLTPRRLAEMLAGA
jgi:CO/xanthine dehydrogenase Mo-binding subunit